MSPSEKRATRRPDRLQGPTVMPMVTSLEDAEGLRCIDIVERDDGSFVIRECRRDPEAGGRWSIVGDYSRLVFATKAEATEAAKKAFPWLAGIAN